MRGAAGRGSRLVPEGEGSQTACTSGGTSIKSIISAFSL